MRGRGQSRLEQFTPVRVDLRCDALDLGVDRVKLKRCLHHRLLRQAHRRLLGDEQLLIHESSVRFGHGFLGFNNLTLDVPLHLERKNADDAQCGDERWPRMTVTMRA